MVPICRKLVSPRYLNSHDTLHGGQLLKWIDEECAIYVISHLGIKRLVTKIIGEADFKSPVYQGDIIEIYGEVLGKGKTSVTMRVEVYNQMTKETVLSLNKIVLVSVDKDFKPVEHGK